MNEETLTYTYYCQLTNERKKNKVKAQSTIAEQSLRMEELSA